MKARRGQYHKGVTWIIKGNPRSHEFPVRAVTDNRGPSVLQHVVILYTVGRKRERGSNRNTINLPLILVSNQTDHHFVVISTYDHYFVALRVIKSCRMEDEAAV